MKSLWSKFIWSHNTLEEWIDRENRLNKETELILSCLPDEVYNSHPLEKIQNDNYRVICEIHKIKYDSITEASRQIGESETQIRTKLYNNYPGYQILEKIKNGYEPIFANGKLYNSITAAVEAGEAKDCFQAMRRLKSLKYTNWNYQSPLKSIDKKIIFYFSAKELNFREDRTTISKESSN